ncbi:MAG TPA: hypothetical protein VJX92_01210 [Methylomirabilota bacterium]|nr:hypothetical protein [Methylomirabilota bacterium]
MSPMPLVSRPVGLAEIDVIAAIPNRILRNLWITTAYHDLALSLRPVLGPNVSWCAFATWASKTAGASIRGEILSQFIRTQLQHSRAYQAVSAPLAFSHPLASAGVHLWPVSRLEDEVLGLFDGPIERVSALIARGNLTVFQELGPAFAALAAVFADGPRPSPAQVDAFLAALAPIDGDPDAATRLRTGFGSYCKVALASGAQAVAELALLAGGWIGLSEQMRLQPVIQAALETPFGDADHVGLEGKVDALLRRWSAAIPDGHHLLPSLDRHRFDLLGDLRDIWRRLTTRLFLSIDVPGGPFALADDVPAPDGGARWPADLVTLRLPDLIAFLEAQDRTGGTAVGSGAGDWANLGQRMNYIVNLFRSWQQQARLLTPPFTDAQVAVMQSGRVPEGPL